jgi:hypothetical protein
MRFACRAFGNPAIAWDVPSPSYLILFFGTVLYEIDLSFGRPI